MKFQIREWGKGLNVDVLPSELQPGFWSSATNVRPCDGFAERVDGISTSGTGSVVPAWMQYFKSGTGLNGFHIAYSDNTKVYAFDNIATHTEITRFTEGAVISTITRVGTTATLTTATNHGRTTGDTVSVWGALPAQYNGTYVITVTGVTTFTYVMASDPGASASPVGLYSYNGATSNFVGGTGRCTGGVLNGVLLYNNPGTGLYYWSGDTATRLRKVPGSYKARVSRPFKNYIFQLAPTVDGVERPYQVAWSDAAEPGSIPTTFTSTAINDAGDVEQTEAGHMVDCLPLGDSLIVYGETGRYSVQYIGGNDIFRFTRVRGRDGLLQRHCVVDTPAGHVFLTKSSEVMLFDGTSTRSLSAGRVKGLIATPGTSSIDTNNFLAVNPQKNEVWVCIANQTGYAHTVLTWNWKDDAWGTKTPQSTTLTAGTVGLIDVIVGEALLVGEATANKIGYVNPRAHQDFGVDFTSIVERVGIDFGDADAMKSLHRSKWAFTAQQVYSVYHGSSSSADGTVTYKAPVIVGLTSYANSFAAANRYAAVKVTWVRAAATDAGGFRSCDLFVATGGKR